MNKPVFYWFLFVLLLVGKPSFSSHIVGGELTYKHLGGDDYEITLIVYRDCFNGVPEFDTPALLQIFDSTNSRLRTIELDTIFSENIPALGANFKCAKVPNNICYERAVYRDVIRLPNIPGGYKLAYGRCCWNNSVTNIVNDAGVDDAGLTISTDIKERASFTNNSSPVFQGLTPFFICLGSTFEFDYSAIDTDGDSLAYEIVTPLNNRNNLDGRTNLPPPPFQEVKYRNGFNLENVMGSNEVLKIDPESGFLSVRPENRGQYVYGVRVKEYRNGVQIGYTDRSYELNVEICEGYTAAVIDVADIYCDARTVDFGNDSQNSDVFEWNFGDTDNPPSTSTDEAPTYVYPDTGVYTVILIAYADSTPCNDTTEKEITLSNAFSATSTFQEDNCLNSVSFFSNATKISGYTNKWNWYFGDNNSSNLQNPVHFYNEIKTYNIRLIAQLKAWHFGCADTIDMVYEAEDKRPEINAIANKNVVFKRQDFALLNAFPNNSYTFSWVPEEGLSDPTVPNPTATPKQTTTYTVSVTDTSGCVNTDEITIYVNEYQCGESEIFIPNAFTPNNDGENDFMRVRGEDIKELYFAIYNRWGEMVFESFDSEMINDPSKGWDGTYKGKKLEPGVFVYYLKATCLSDTEFIKKGNITLIR